MEKTANRLNPESMFYDLEKTAHRLLRKRLTVYVQRATYLTFWNKTAHRLLRKRLTVYFQKGVNWKTVDKLENFKC